MGSILIESSARDATAAEVILWLKHWGLTPLWIHEENPVTEFSLTLSDQRADLALQLQSGLRVELADVDACWYRQAALTTRLPGRPPAPLAQLLEAEWAAARAAFTAISGPRRRLGEPRLQSSPNLVQLLQAQALGIAIPTTLVANTRAALRAFLQTHPKAITKRIEALPQLELNGTQWAAGGTRRITLEEVEALEPSFFPALVQAEVPKAYELRIVYLQGELSAMALLTAYGQEPLVDVRTPPSPEALRLVPYHLPERWQQQLTALMQALSLDSGSIDAIVTPEDICVFLEVNPAGQLDGLSKACNYHLEERIARLLAGELTAPSSK